MISTQTYWPHRYLHFQHDRGSRLHFAHANGYPPEAYTAFLTELNAFFEVYAMEARPLWSGYEPKEIHTWKPFGDDLHNFFQSFGTTTKWVGVGHSIGGTATLMTAIKQPGLFDAIVVIDPPFFSPPFSRFWNLVYLAGLAYNLHPLAKGALRRKRSFQTLEEMLTNYRKKKVFRHFSDQALREYANSIAIPTPTGKLSLRYPPEWEARIYVTSARFDSQVWRKLATLKMPILVIRGSENPTFWNSTMKRFLKIVPHAQFEDITGATHLVPLEKPQKTAKIIEDFLIRNSIR